MTIDLIWNPFPLKDIRNGIIGKTAFSRVEHKSGYSFLPVHSHWSDCCDRVVCLYIELTFCTEDKISTQRNLIEGQHEKKRKSKTAWKHIAFDCLSLASPPLQKNILSLQMLMRSMGRTRKDLIETEVAVCRSTSKEDKFKTRVLCCIGRHWYITRTCWRIHMAWKVRVSCYNSKGKIRNKELLFSKISKSWVF